MNAYSEIITKISLITYFKLVRYFPIKYFYVKIMILILQFIRRRTSR